MFTKINIALFQLFRVIKDFIILVFVPTYIHTICEYFIVILITIPKGDGNTCSYSTYTSLNLLLKKYKWTEYFSIYSAFVRKLCSKAFCLVFLSIKIFLMFYHFKSTKKCVKNIKIRFY